MGKTVSTTWKRGNRTVVPGTEISVRGLRGRLKFRQHVVLDDGRAWIDLVGDTGFHSVRPERVKTVHRVSKMRPARVGAVAVAA
jgi:hypothetical protein